MTSRIQKFEKTSLREDSNSKSKKKSTNDIIAKLESELSIAKAEGNAQAILSITKIIKYFTSKK